MIRFFILFTLSALLMVGAANALDWLIDPTPFKAQIEVGEKSIALGNGLVRREIQISPNAATISFRRQDAGEEFVRAIRPEAEIVINGVRCDVGGLVGQPVHNYILPQWLDEMTADPKAFQFVDYKIGPTQERFPWKKRLEWMPGDAPWPPPGKRVSLIFKTGEIIAKRHPALKNVRVIVHYEIYDGLPVISKWLTVENGSDKPVRINRFKSEILAVVEPQSVVGQPPQWLMPNMSVVTDYTFGGDMAANGSIGKSVFWEQDSLYETQVNYQRQTPCLLECRPQIGPAVDVPPGETFTSFRTFELLHDRWERERKGLAERKMYRAVAPWATENPILMHVRKADDKSVKLAIDQCGEVGFEMVIMTFGSGFNLEDQSEKNLQRMQALADYAHAKGIALGGYSLLASRRIDDENDVVMPEGKTPVFGHSPCLESEWGNEYFDKLYDFYEATSLDVLEHDGSYPGDVCASTKHPGHEGLADSQWKQFKKISDFYKWCRGRGVYLNVPDWYFLNGSNKIAMGYQVPLRRGWVNLFNHRWDYGKEGLLGGFPIEKLCKGGQPRDFFFLRKGGRIFKGVRHSKKEISNKNCLVKCSCKPLDIQGEGARDKGKHLFAVFPCVRV